MAPRAESVIVTSCTPSSMRFNKMAPKPTSRAFGSATNELLQARRTGVPIERHSACGGADETQNPAPRRLVHEGGHIGVEPWMLHKDSPEAGGEIERARHSGIPERLR